MSFLKLKEYRCPKDNNLLFKGSLKEGTHIVIMCKNKSNKDEKGKYSKCRTSIVIKGAE